MHNLTPDYIVGLVDGEGSFTVYIRDVDIEKKVKRRVVVEPKFYIKLIDKDKNILYVLKEFFGCGSVYFQKDKRPNHQNCYRYEVYNRSDLLEIIIPFFKKHKLKFTSKRNDFEVFCVLVKMIMREEHRTKSGLKKMFALKQTMH
ncbi:MAG: LAGLIDADG family homing endonuclease [Candidatus Zambryskibacteria bacterium]|nr:LAGLIDADG family homing endonuclease [Candidatus Zambryskibacteria bacterium]